MSRGNDDFVPAANEQIGQATGAYESGVRTSIEASASEAAALLAQFRSLEEFVAAKMKLTNCAHGGSIARHRRQCALAIDVRCAKQHRQRHAAAVVALALHVDH